MREVDRSKDGQTLQKLLDQARDGAVIAVAGDCVENIRIDKNRITLSDLPGATLTGAGNDRLTILVSGHNVTIQDFSYGFIRGGSHVVIIHRGGSATLQNNMITSSRGNGIIVNQTSYARIIKNHIHSNGTYGVSVNQSGSADIFDNLIGEKDAQGNSLGNRLRKIQVSGFAGADIDDNDIMYYGSNGIRVRRTAHVSLSDDGSFGGTSLIENNASRGIRCQSNSSIKIETDQN